MSTGDSLSPNNTPNWRLVRGVLLKAALIFLIANMLFALGNTIPALGKLSLYNHLFPGRTRLPYGENPDRSYNLSLFDLDAMFASHEISAREKPLDEFRVILLGDSSTWGYLLASDQTLSSALNRADYSLPDGRQVRFYNLGYPVMSLLKDLLILSRLQQYDADLIVWPVTLESFPYDKQLYPPLLQNNPVAVRKLVADNKLQIDNQDPSFIDISPLDRTLAGSLRAIADWWRLQLYGVMWAATGIDQDIPAEYTPRLEDLPADDLFHNLKPPHLREEDLALEIIQAGIRLAGDTPILLINEPMFMSKGQNSDIRYNFYYPRWAYDNYLRIMQEQSREHGWNYADLWDSIPPTYFTNTAVHLSPEGNQLLASKVLPLISEIVEFGELERRPPE